MSSRVFKDVPLQPSLACPVWRAMADFSTPSMLIISYGMYRPSARGIYYKEGGGIIFYSCGWLREMR